MPSDAPAIKRERVAADGAEIVTVGTAVRRAPRAGRGDRRGAGARDHPAVRRRPDHRRAGHGRARDRRGPAETSRRSSCRSVAAGSRAASPWRSRRWRRALASSASSRSSPPMRASRWPRARSSAGRPRTSARTIADGTRTQALGERTFAHLRAHLDGIVTVTEAEIAAAVRLAAERSRLVAEPSGALALAAIAFHAARARPATASTARSSPSSAAGTSIPRSTAPTSRRRSPADRPRARGRAVRPARRSRTRMSASSAAARRSERPMSRASARIQPNTIAMTATRKMASPTSHMIPAAACWSCEGGRPPGALERGVVRVEHGRALEQHDGEERVLRHLEEDVQGPRRVRHPPRRRVQRDRRPPEQQRRAEEQRVLQVVDQRVLERRVEQRREVADPHDRREDHPGDDRERQDPDDSTSGGPAGSSGAASRARRPAAPA